jgi:predicted SnoaL-like aldol condensation-catalyzing enzyme
MWKNATFLKGECVMSVDKKEAIRPLELFKSESVAEFDQLVDEMFSSDYTLHDPSMPNFGTGPGAVKQFMHSVIENTPDVHIVVQDVIAEGDKVAVRFTVYGTNKSTGKPEVTEVMCFSRYSDGKIVEEWQLGVQTPVLVEM